MLALASRSHTGAASTIQGYKGALAIIAVVALAISIFLIKKSYLGSNNLHFRYFYLLGASCVIDLAYLALHKAPPVKNNMPVLPFSSKADPYLIEVNSIISNLIATRGTPESDDALFQKLQLALWSYKQPGSAIQRTISLPRVLEPRIAAYFDRMQTKDEGLKLVDGSLLWLPARAGHSGGSGNRSYALPGRLTGRTRIYPVGSSIDTAYDFVLLFYDP